MVNQKKAYFYASLSILCWSTVATAFKIALREQSPYQVITVAAIASMLVLGVSLLLSGKFHLVARSTGKEIMWSALLGLLNPVFYYLILFNAYGHLPAQVAQPLNMIWPVVLVIISVPLLKQKIERKSLVALLVSFAGIIVVSSQGGGKSFSTGQVPYMLLALSTSLIWSFYWILNVRDKRNEQVRLFMSFFFASIYLAGSSLITGRGFPVNPMHWMVDIYIGLFEMGLAFLFWLRALQYSGSTDKISNLVFIFPFISLIFIHYILGETIHLTTLYGLLLVVAGIIIQKTRILTGLNVRKRQDNIRN